MDSAEEELIHRGAIHRRKSQRKTHNLELTSRVVVESMIFRTQYVPMPAYNYPVVNQFAMQPQPQQNWGYPSPPVPEYAPEYGIVHKKRIIDSY